MMLLKQACLYIYGVSEQSYLLNILPIAMSFALPSQLLNKRDDPGRVLKLYIKVSEKCSYNMYSLFSSWCTAFRQVHYCTNTAEHIYRPDLISANKQVDLSNLSTFHKKLNNDCSFYSFIIQHFWKESDNQKVNTLAITWWNPALWFVTLIDQLTYSKIYFNKI